MDEVQPVESGRDNALINTHILDASWRGGARPLLALRLPVPTCAFVPFREETMWDGLPEPTNGPIQAPDDVPRQGHQHQHGFPARFAVLANLYGPGTTSLPSARTSSQRSSSASPTPTSRLPGDPHPHPESLRRGRRGWDARRARLGTPRATEHRHRRRASIADLARAVARAAGYAGPSSSTGPTGRTATKAST